MVETLDQPGQEREGRPFGSKTAVGGEENTIVFLPSESVDCRTQINPKMRKKVEVVETN